MPAFSSHAWRARIESLDGGRVLGTGFLIDRVNVLTCAHVVDGRDKVRVSFLGAATPVSVEASVDFRGPWHQGSERGDIATLVLNSPTTVEAARLADATDLLLPHHGARPIGLNTHGYPRGFDEGVDTRVQAPYQALNHAEWLQLEAGGDRGIPLQKGFSGAAVTRADSGEVVGMIIGAEASLTTGMGKMLPLRVIESYWPQLGDYLPLGSLPAAAGQELHEILSSARVNGSPSDIFRRSLPSGIGPEHEPFPTLWDAARFAAESTSPQSADPRDNPLVRFCGVVLRRAVSQRTTDRLREWLRHHCQIDDAFTLDQDDSQPTTGLIVIRVAPSADVRYCNLTVQAFAGRSGHGVYSDKTKLGLLRSTVERILPAAFRHIPEWVSSDNLVIQFELPRSLLDKPVDEWLFGGIPIGWRHPVVVRDLEDGDDDVRRLARVRWQVLTAQDQARLHMIDCRDSRPRERLIAWLLAGTDRTILALSNPPRTQVARKAVAAGLASGVPAMLWTRAKCTDDHEKTASCGGDRFLELLAKALDSTPPRDLPEKIRRLRAAAEADRGEMARCKAVTLFWRDPGLTPPDQSRLVLAE